MAPITTHEALRARLGHPHEMTEQKIEDHVFEEARQFIERAPILFLATVSKEGETTVSPKGGEAGFVAIEDDKTLLIPERPGNRLLHSLTNIVDTGEVGLIFLVPGTEETLRVNGRVTIEDDDELCARFIWQKKPALIVQKLAVREVFFHCAKAFRRSGTWQPDQWPEPIKISFGDMMTKKSGGNALKRKAVAVAVDQAVKHDYKHNL